jgi:Molecular chaperone (small heat shock protein)
MQETQTNQTDTKTRQASGNAGGGVKENQQVTQGTQGGGVSRRESSGQESRALRSQGSRQLTSASQSPFAMMRQLSREMDRLMDSFFDRGFGSFNRDGGLLDEERSSSSFWAPQIDVQRRNDAVVVCADLPGLRKEDVQIEIENDALVISGQRREEREDGEEDRGYRVYERSYGSFYRTVPLPRGTDPENIKAEMRDGVLKVTLPLPENARPRKIQIQS